MADITMCKGVQMIGNYDVVCPKRDKCYRHTATQNEHRQSWFIDIPLLIYIDGTFAECKYFDSNGA